ncbi:MAG: family N-acetyltransferase [Rhodocyclales bacterium]|nr:family N-acetyltransferase [Rhodocyclales bacterium]
MSNTPDHTSDDEPENADFETCDFGVEDVAEIAQLFRDAIRVTAAGAYSPEQLAAWAGSADDEDAFAAALNAGWVRVAVDDVGIVGFAQINMPGHIAMLYTAPRVARRGVATLLLDDMLVLGEAMGATKITVDASIVGRPLFAHFGFVEECEELVERHGISFKRYRMQRSMKRPRK